MTHQLIVLNNLTSIASALDSLADVARGLRMSHKDKATQYFLIYDELMSNTEDVKRLRLDAEADNMESAQYEDMGAPVVQPMTVDVEAFFRDDNIRVNMEPDKDADREMERGDQ